MNYFIKFLKIRNLIIMNIQKLLKSMHAYLSEKNSFTNENYLTLYGTSTYHVIWEEICCRVLGDKLDKKLNDLKMPVKSNSSNAFVL